MVRIDRAVRNIIHSGLAVAALLPVAVHAASPTDSLTMVALGTVNTGGAEISAYDPQSRQLYVTNAGASTVSIVSLRDPASPAVVKTIDVSNLGSPNSVAVGRGVVAVAIEDTSHPLLGKTRPGTVAFYRTDGDFLASVRVGALPDMLTFTPDGNHVLVANEGEPSSYGQPDSVDPEGTVSIIPVPQGFGLYKKLSDTDVRTVDFRAFNGKAESLRQMGVRIYGPGASVAQDFEPEYITVSPDSKTAYVTLQENNAIAKIDIASARVLNLLPLGYKNWNEQPFTSATFEWPSASLPSIGTAGGQDLKLGGFSGLVYEGATSDGKLEFIVNTDRGPNGEPNAAAERPFLLPGFAPRLVRFTLDPVTGRFELTQQILLRRPDGTPLTGLPNTRITGGTTNTPHNDEVPVDLFGRVLPLDSLGGDFEGLVVADDGSFWLCDEYRPALYHFDPQGILLERYVPTGAHAAAGLAVPAVGAPGALGIEALPAVLGQRRQNRGMEAIAFKDGKLYAFVQSPLRNPPSTSNALLNGLRNIRVVEFDLATRTTTKQFLYVMDNPVGTGNDTRADKIGDAVAVPGGFLVLERDDDATTDDPSTSDPLATITKRIYRFDLSGATDLTAAVDKPYDIGGVLKTPDLMTAAELASVGIKPLAKTLEVDLAAAGYTSVQKVEGLAQLDDGRLAVINDNDFTVAQIAIDNSNGTFTRLPGYTGEPITLGIIDRPGLDASDRDNKIVIRPWPVLGMYEPDAIANYSVGGRQFLVTANEGDARDWTGFSEEARVGSLALDTTSFPTSFDWKNNANLGRLNVTRTLGNTDADAEYETLYTLGGRSFSIWSTSGKQVYDSGSQLERIVANENENEKVFNASNDDNTFDSRSDNKGPEPEGLALGEIGGRHYAFVGLERDSGIVAYDITTPESPLFVDYVNNRDFAQPVNSPAAGDLGPEGLLFIPAKDSPTSQPLLVVSNEVSHTVTTYGITLCVRKPENGQHLGRDARCVR